MNKDDKIIIVVKRENLFGEETFQGFRLHNEVDYESRILRNLEGMRRGDAEINPEYKQPIAYIIVSNPDKRVLTYQRAKKDEHYGEKRLQGKWSWGVGGHIDDEEINHQNPLHSSLSRELEEEVGLDIDECKLEVLGYINDDSNSVGQVHFGILYLAKTNKEVKPVDPEIVSCSFKSLKELEEICQSCDVETWSQIALPVVRKHFEKVN